MALPVNTLTVARDPIADLAVATKSYVDSGDATVTQYINNQISLVRLGYRKVVVMRVGDEMWWLKADVKPVRAVVRKISDKRIVCEIPRERGGTRLAAIHRHRLRKIER